MVPKTTIQKKVFALSSKLPSITVDQEQYAYQKCFELNVVRSRKTLFCLECGHSWKDGAILVTAVVGCTCPECGKALKLKQNYYKAFKAISYYGIITTKGGMQVVRMFFVVKFMKKLQAPSYSIHEVMQHWIDIDGSVTTMALPVMGLSNYFDQWIFERELEVRSATYRHSLRYDLNPEEIYPERKVLPIIKRNGFKRTFHDIAPHKLFSLLLSDPHAETLIKTGQIPMLRHNLHNTASVNEYWNSIKICIRNKYTIRNVEDWKDLIDLLRYFHKDVLNHKYVCPSNFKQLHDKLVEKKRNIDKRIRDEEMRSKMDTEQKKYAKHIAKFLDLRFEEDGIEVATIATVEDFCNEGDTLRHCLFTNEYWKKKDSLIMSAKINNQSVETIEVSLKNFEVVQSRGIKNRATPYHGLIVNIIQRNMNLISSRAKAV